MSKPVWILLSGILFAHLGYYLILPLLTIILSTQRGLSLVHVGTILATASISYLISSLIGGAMADRFGKKRIMLIGLVLRGLGIGGYAYAYSITALLTTSVVSGVGGGLYMPPAKAGIASFVTSENKTTAFSLRGIAANIGVTVGPVIGSLLFAKSTTAVFLTAGATFLVLAVEHGFLLERDRPAEVRPKQTKIQLRVLLQDRTFLAFSGLTVFVWALYTQLTFAIPIRATEILANPGRVGLLWTITSIMVIFLQAPLSRIMTKWMHPLLSMSLGVAIMGVGLGTVAWSSRFEHLLISAAIFTIGEMFVMPTSDAVVSELARPDLIGSYFGVSAFVWGLGESIGNVAGGKLMQIGTRTGNHSFPWLVFMVSGLVIGAAYLILLSWKALAGPLKPSMKKKTDVQVSSVQFSEHDSKKRSWLDRKKGNI